MVRIAILAVWVPERVVHHLQAITAGQGRPHCVPHAPP